MASAETIRQVGNRQLILTSSDRLHTPPGALVAPVVEAERPFQGVSFGNDDSWLVDQNFRWWVVVDNLDDARVVTGDEPWSALTVMLERMG